MTKDEAVDILLRELNAGYLTSTFAVDVINGTKIPKESKNAIAANLLLLRKVAYRVIDLHKEETHG